MISTSKLIISQINDEIRSFLIKDNNAERIFVSHKDDFSIGDIVLCRVQKVKKDLNAVFVELNKNTVGFLPLKEVNFKYITNRQAVDSIKENDTIAAMITKEAVKSKPVSLSCKLSIQGNFSVVHTDGNELTVSNKISSESKKELYSKYISQLPDNNLGYILRTNAESADENEIIQELVKNTNEINKVLSTMQTRTVYSKLYEAVPAYISQIRTVSKNMYDDIVTDSSKIYNQVKQFIGGNVSLYSDNNLPLSALYSLEKHFHNATSRKINLPSGGYLIIDPCEALTVIDVNSGKALAKSKEENINIINEEAAKEIAHQLILRNISGIIIIDFINYSDRDNEAKLINLFKLLLKNDPVSVKFVDITPLGLVEITRQKKYASIYDNISKQ